MRHLLRAFPGMLRVGFAEALAYRAEFLIWVFAYTMPAIMLALWSEVAREAPVGRFGQAEFRAYFLCTLVVRLTTGTWVVWEMNTEVRQGTLARRLLRPVHPMIAYFAENVAALPMRYVVGLSVLALGWGLVPDGSFTRDPVCLALIVPSVFGAFLLSFLAMGCIGTLAFYWESSMAVFDLWLGLWTVLSGYVMPIEFFPPALRAAAGYMPFRSMLGYPVENMLGLIDRASALREAGLQLAWVAALGLLLHVLWQRGLRRFEAYGG